MSTPGTPTGTCDASRNGPFTASSAGWARSPLRPTPAHGPEGQPAAGTAGAAARMPAPGRSAGSLPAHPAARQRQAAASTRSCWRIIVKDYRRRLGPGGRAPRHRHPAQGRAPAEPAGVRLSEESLRTLAHLLPDDASRQRVVAQISTIVPNGIAATARLGKVSLSSAGARAAAAGIRPAAPAADDAAIAIEEEKPGAAEPEAPAQQEAKAAAEPEAPAQPEARPHGTRGAD